MTESKLQNTYLPIPTTRFSRLLRFGKLGASITTNMVKTSTKNILIGTSSTKLDMLLMEENILRIVKELSQMRGAALKIGQLLSLEGGAFLPEKANEALAILRDNAYKMPPKQLKTRLITCWGENFLDKFKYFDVNPIAAASIGQVHRCKTTDGKRLAIKIQYPGVRESIDSDIKNLWFLISKSGLIPSTLDIKPLLDLARIQLYEETDYIKEAKALNKFFVLLKNDGDFEVPKLCKELSSTTTLAMEFKEGISIEKTKSLDQATRDKIITKLFALVFRELFEFKMIQSDPNFANFLFNEKSKKIILVDFGATKIISKKTVNQFTKLLQATQKKNKKKVKSLFHEMRFLDKDLPTHLADKILEIYHEASVPLTTGIIYDFKKSNVIKRMQEMGFELLKFRHNISIPNFETLLIQRKIGGIFLLAHHLEAKVDINWILKKYLL